MPAVLPITTKSTAAERRNDRDLGFDASAALRLVTYKFLLGWQYYNALLCTCLGLPRMR
jgi:hypothetical protein